MFAKSVSVWQSQGETLMRLQLLDASSVESLIALSNGSLHN